MLDIQSALNTVWAGYVEHYNFDLLSHKVKFDIRITKNGEVTRHKLVFTSIASFYFVEGMGDERFNRPESDEGDCIELSSVRFFQNGIGDLSLSPNDSWKNRYPGVPNFAIEMWNAMLFIEAASVALDEVTFSVGYVVP